MNAGPSVPQPALQLVAFLSEPTPHGIDLKKPFTMSNIGSGVLTPSLPVSTTGISFASSLGICLVRGGAYRDRTDDLMLAKQPLSQLS